ncbi:MAG: hypothetical protein JXI43_07900 [Tissierellales bacterium]|nr:hypothetical protein [Tissierellales bacterium]
MNKSELANVMVLTHVPTRREREQELSRCHVCLSKTDLTREHIPPKSAFNHTNKLWDRLILKHSATSKKMHIRGGFWVQTLCEKCNNEIGALYAQQYVNFVKDLVMSPKLFTPTNDARLFNIRADTLYIAKEIAIMILASESLAFAEENQELRAFVLNRQRIIQPPFQVLAFLVPDVEEAGTMSRFHARVDTFAPGFRFAGGEISCYPFGFVYARDIGKGYEVEYMTDITHWFMSANLSERHNRIEQFYTRITGVESMQCIHGQKRYRPRIDYF